MGRKKTEDKLAEVKIPIHSFKGTKKEQLERLYDDWFKCQRCPLKDFRCNDMGEEVEDIVFCSGNPDSGIMIIGEAPGEEEANELLPFVGKSGKLLNQILASVAADEHARAMYRWYSKVAHTKSHEQTFHGDMFEWRDKNFFFTNIVSCRPPENRTPIPDEIAACSERLLNMIYIVDPVLIIATGKVAAEALLRKKIEITQKRGELMEMYLDGKVGKLSYPVMLTLHPSYLLRKADWNVVGGDYGKTVGDFMKAMKVYDFLMEKHFDQPAPVRGIMNG